MEAAVLLEAGWDAMVDEVWVIAAPHAAVLERLASRNGLSAEQAEARIAKQMSADERLARCHVPLSSAFGEAGTRQQLRTALEGASRRRAQTLATAPAQTTASTFHSLCEEAGVPAAHASEWWGRLRDGMCAVGRYYHTMAHVEAMLARVAALEARGVLRRPSLVRFAIFFHDIVYDATAKDNEAQSAARWREFAAKATALSDDDVEVVGRYIERTAQHLTGPATGDLAHFLDTDLAVLALPPAAYAEYARQVRLEYAHVPTADFVKGRSKVLGGFLGGDRLFFTAEGVDELDAAARANIAAEQTRLAHRL